MGEFDKPTRKREEKKKNAKMAVKILIPLHFQFSPVLAFLKWDPTVLPLYFFVCATFLCVLSELSECPL